MTSTGTRSPVARSASQRLHIALWIAQGLVALTFVGAGVWKLVTPIPQLAGMIPWAGDVPPTLLYTVAVIDILGGLGVLLPSLTRIRPGLAVLAGLGCLALQLSAVLFHLFRGEATDTPFNFLLVAILIFIVWGRQVGAPIQPRA